MVGDWSRGFWELFLETHRLYFNRRVSSVWAPSLVVTGEHDLTVKTEESFRLARELPRAELLVIDNCAHLPQEEKPREFVEGVKAFVGRLA